METTQRDLVRNPLLLMLLAMGLQNFLPAACILLNKQRKKILSGAVVYADAPDDDHSPKEVKLPTDVRMVLVGKTGAGKSATGNTILGREAFKAEASASSITSQTQRAEGEVQFYNGVDSVNITVIDTPGLFDTSLSVAQVKAEIDRCINMSLPGPHVFLLVISLNRWTQETRDTLKWIQANFGEEANCHTIILFTGVDQLNGKPVKTFLEESDEVQALLRKCKGRYHVFNNQEKNDRTQVTELLQKTASVVRENGGAHYTSEIFQEAQRKIQEAEERLRLEEERQKRCEEDILRFKIRQEMLEREKQAEEGRDRTRKIVTGVAAACATVAAAIGFAPLAIVGGVAAGLASFFG